MQSIFQDFREMHPRVPIFITQHMPPMFTACLASNLAIASGMVCVEGKDGEPVQAGRVYIAPGDYHMVVKQERNQVIIRLNKDPKVNSCRPSADPMFASLSEVYKKKLVAVVLTGMGRDGCNGAKAIASKGGVIISQDAESSVVYGMPRAVAEANIGSIVLPLDKISRQVAKYL